MRKSREKTKKG
jgi:hypothetical protein